MRVAAQLCPSRRMSCHAFVDTSHRRDLARFVRAYPYVCVRVHAGKHKQQLCSNNGQKLHFRFKRFPHGNAFDACLKYWPKSLRLCDCAAALRSLPAHRSARESCQRVDGGRGSYCHYKRLLSA